jgi:aminopeptidase N
MQDHYLQLLVIERLFKERHDFAIGMEMFPASSQEVLDEYILGTTGMDEKTFLKRSHYFQVWNYDYRYYKGIIDFARKHKIPLVGLNIERDIVSSIFKNGSTSQLSEKQRSLLPKERDLSIPGYFERLRYVHGLHAHGGGNKGLGGFIQAQGVWDEVMADNIASYLRNNPTQKMVVLAGAEHARKDNGIPPRVSRRIEASQVVAMTINEGRTPSAELADYFFYLPPQELAPAGKIGISIEEIQKADETFLKIVTLSPASNAAKSGLLSEDIIIETNGFPIKNMEDLRIAIAGKQAGDNISMKVRREVDQSEKEFDLNIALYSPADTPQTQKN